MAGPKGEIIAMSTRRDAWSDTHRRLSARPPDELTAAELDALADALFWLDQPVESAAMWHRAYVAHKDCGDVAGATMAAWRAFFEHFQVGERAIASGWLERLRQLTADRDHTLEAGYVAVAEAGWAHVDGDLETALEQCRRAVAVGRDAADPDLTALAGETQGRVLIALDRAPEGLRLLDDAMVSVIGGELDPLFTGWIFCEVLSVCRDLADMSRAREWTDAAMRWCDSIGEGRAYTGICRVHRVELQCLHGAWAAAEAEIERACDELTSVDPRYAGEAFYVAGELRRLRGDHAEAEEAYRRAHELGRPPQPGLALVRLAQGQVDTALAALHRALSQAGSAPLARVRVLAALVEAQLRAGEVGPARAAADELTRVATVNGPYLGAIQASCHGAVLLAEGDTAAAVEHLGRARDAFADLGMPFDAARAQVLLGTAARRDGDTDGARLELASARAVFARLGATGELETLDALLRGRQRRPGGLTDRQLEVLRLVAEGRTDREIAAALVISQHTVARHISNIRTRLGVPSRAAATAFAYEHDLV
ncbi:MAG: LuxR family transcriptional regulator [Nitriliruptorales bacterium]|nr:LuxR family transcriptional regulator [Nitriliruptorales bacterium]